MFYCLTALVLHKTLNSPPALPAFGALLASAFLPSSIALWVLADARRRHPVPYDFGSVLYFTWPFLVPIYLFSTRSWRAFAPLGCFLLLYFAAALTGVIPSLFATRP
jgi:hypothetical protein